LSAPTFGETPGIVPHVISFVDDSLRWARESGQRDPLTHVIIGCAIRIHTLLKPGLRENSYDDALYVALMDSGLSVVRQSEISPNFGGHALRRSYRPDLIVNEEVVVEIKCVMRFLPEHDSQLLTYMRHARIERGLLLNFHARRMAAGIRRLILSPIKGNPP
jgi:GxxExxY protein